MSPRPTNSLRPALTLLALLGMAFPAGLAAQAATKFMEISNGLLPNGIDEVTSLAQGDLDGDGDADLVVGRLGADMLLLNQGGGRFTDASKRLPANADYTTAIALGDVDADGDLDIVIGTNRGRDRLYRNDGKGNFQDVPNHVEGGATGPVALADMDGDKDLDLLVGGQWTNSSFIAWNDGKGVFTRASQTLPRYTATILPRDVDGDGDVDVLLTASGQLHLLQNNGKGKLTDVSSSNLPTTATSVLFQDAADVDRDGDVDVVLQRYGAGNVLLINDGKGRFTDASLKQMPQFKEYEGRLLLVDLNGDKAPELVQFNNEMAGQGGIDRLFSNDGKGTFTDATASLGFTNLLFQVRVVIALDADNDGDQDIFVGGHPGLMRLRLGDGRGHLTEVNTPFLIRDNDPTKEMITGDIDGDGDLDLITNANMGVRIFVNDGRGRFTDETQQRIPMIRFNLSAIVLGDVDGDRDLDLVTSGDGLFLNDGKGVFKDASSQMPKDIYITRDIALGDVDGDGDADLVLAKQQAQNRLYVNDGKGNFKDVTAANMPVDAAYTWALDLGDVDKDGDLDLVLGNLATSVPQAGNDWLYVNDGKGRFKLASANLPKHDEMTYDLALGDLDGDGDLDLVTATGVIWGNVGRDRLYTNDGKGRFSDASATGLPLMREHTNGLGLADVDGDGDLDLVHCNSQDSVIPTNAQNVMFINDGRGKFTNQTPLWLPARGDQTYAIVLGDMDGDRDVDIVVGNINPSASTFVSNSLYFNFTRQLIGPDIVHAGRTHTMSLVSWTGGGSSASRVAIPLVSVGGAQVAVPPFGVLGINLSQSVTLPAVWLPSDPMLATYKIFVPANPAFVGIHLYGQALIADLVLPKATWRLTNTIECQIH